MSSVSQETEEWQQMARREKHHVQYAETSHFSMQNMSSPMFHHSMEPVTVVEGEQAVFTVEYQGSPCPAVKWFRYSFPVHDSKDFKIHTTDTGSTLTIAKTCADDSGVFTCLLENIVGAAKSSSNLNVMESGQEYVMQASTKCTRTLKEMTVNTGDSIRFDIGFSGGTRDNLQFFHDGNRLEEETGVKIQVENDVASLIIENAGPSNSGVYECKMKTEGGEASCQVKCEVLSS